MVETLQRIQASINPELTIEGVLLTMFDDRPISPGGVNDIREFFTVLSTSVIPRNVRLGRSFGRPILSTTSSPGAEAYMNLARGDQQP
jgi:chromosome partitioning protein